MNSPISWKAETRKLATLKEWTKNPRKITAEEFEALKEGIAKRGFHDVLKTDIDGTIISGHQRRRALIDLGIEEVTVLMPDRALTNEEKEIIAIESNRHRGTFDFDILANEFDMNILLESGFKEFELGFATADRLENEPDKDSLKDTMTSYLDGSVRQVTLYFSVEEYEKLLPRLDAVMEGSGVKSHTEVFLKILEEYENHTSHKKAA